MSEKPETKADEYGRDKTIVERCAELLSEVDQAHSRARRYYASAANPLALDLVRKTDSELLLGNAAVAQNAHAKAQVLGMQDLRGKVRDWAALEDWHRIMGCIRRKAEEVNRLAIDAYGMTHPNVMLVAGAECERPTDCVHATDDGCESAMPDVLNVGRAYEVTIKFDATPLLQFMKATGYTKVIRNGSDLSLLR